MTADGLGVAMGIRPYIDDDLAAGRLVAPFEQAVPKGMRWYLVYRGSSHRAARLCYGIPALDHPRAPRAIAVFERSGSGRDKKARH